MCQFPPAQVSIALENDLRNAHQSGRYDLCPVPGPGADEQHAFIVPCDARRHDLAAAAHTLQI